MLLDTETFDRVRQLAKDNGYPHAVVQYAGAEKDIVWFKVTDGRFAPRRACRLAIREDFTIAYEAVHVYIISVRDKRFRVACSSCGRTLSRV